MRDAQSLLDQVIAFAGKTVRDQDVGAALGLADRTVLYAVAEAIVEHNPAAALERLHELHLYGYDMRRFARELLEHFRNLSVARLLPAADLLADLPEEERVTVERQAANMTHEDLDRAFRLLLATESEVSHVPYPKLVLEMALIKLATLTPVVAVDELLDRIDELEQRLGAGTASAGGSAPIRPAGKSGPDTRRDPTARAHHSASHAAAPGAHAAAVTAPADGERSWDEFLAFVAKEKVTLVPYLRSSQPTHPDGATLALLVPSGYYYDYLAQRDHTQLVEELAQRFFGRPVRITVAAVEVQQAAAPSREENPATLHAAALGDPVVRAAVEIFGGEVQEVKSRARRRGSE